MRYFHPFFSLKSDFSSLSEWTLPMPETKIWDHFSIQIYPLLVGNMASETTFGHWKVVFSWGKGRKMTFSQNPLKTRFWASGFWMSISSSANFKKDPPWYIFSLSVHAPATSGGTASYKWSSGWISLLQMTTWTGQPLANGHSDGPASCKWSPGGSSLLQMITWREQPLANDHPDQPDSSPFFIYSMYA